MLVASIWIWLYELYDLCGLLYRLETLKPQGDYAVVVVLLNIPSCDNIEKTPFSRSRYRWDRHRWSELDF